MLYVSTRNQKDTFTAYRALHEASAPDGGIYVPFHLPTFTQDELMELKQKSPCEIIANILNLFFGVKLSAWNIECEIGKTPFKLVSLQHKFVVAECWKNPGFSCKYLLRNIYGLMTDRRKTNTLPEGWACVGIKIALLFAMFAQLNNTLHKIDIAVTAGDFSDMTAIAYSKAMGLPVHMTVCSCDSDNIFWDLINRGECTVGNDIPHFFESYLYVILGSKKTALFIDAMQNRNVFYLDTDEEEPTILPQQAFAAVVSQSRVDPVITNMYHTNAYTFDAEAALSYSALQDYRSSTGFSRDTLLFSKCRPNSIKE